MVFILDPNPLNSPVLSLQREGQKQFSVSFSDPIIANNFVISGIKKVDPSWVAYIPDSCIFNIGLILDIPPDITIENLQLDPMPSRWKHP